MASRAKKKAEMGSPDWILLGAVAALIAIGLMVVYSSTFDLGYRLYGDEAHFFRRQLIFMGIGAVAMIVAMRMHYRHWMKISLPLMALTVIVLIIMAALQERLLLQQSVSPVEIAKLAVVIYIGHWLASKRAEQLRNLPVGLLPFTIIVGIVAGLVMVQPDISEAMVIVLVALAMFFLAGAPALQFGIGLLGGGAAFVFVISRIPYAMDRIEPYLTGWRNPLEGGTQQLVQGLIGLGSGGLTGLGPGNGLMKYQWLPAAHTDSIFAIVGEEMGLIGSLALVALFGLMAYRGFRISAQATEPFGRLVALGITCWITIQALVNLAVVTGTIPFTGIALPFISVGGSSLVTCMIAMGILLSISRVNSAAHSAAEAKSARVHMRTSSSARQGTAG
ncbi:MAG: putative peptidoglycan glycosyltransferase FtsW [Anaerolineae bacterium]|jgi:cell division protein FtsW